MRTASIDCTVIRMYVNTLAYSYTSNSQVSQLDFQAII